MTAVNVEYDEQIKIFNSKQAVISGGEIMIKMTK